MQRTDWTVLVALAVALATATGDARSETVSPFAPCAPPLESVVACENSKPGNPASEWDVDGAGDASIQGFATPFSANRGETVRFRVKTDAAAYRIDVYRLGYYGGLGARKVATLAPTAALPQQQPECVREQSTGLVDCGNWAESAAWELPADAVSGVYVGKLVRDDTGGESLVYFVVRDDERGSDVLFQTADTTWQAYNRYGGNSLYFGSPAGRAYKVSYNRPLTTRDYNNTSFFFNGEYPLLRWLERNGYDVSYTAGVDTAARGAELLEHEVFLSVGHDEYWSKAQRANVEAARDAGVSLAFFSGNEVFWKTRWEPSIDGSATPFTTLVSYKETAANAKIDPHPEWTGTWRDPRFSPPADGGSPENALTGTLFTVNAYREDGIEVPAAFGKLRLWRHTDIASLGPGEVATLPKGTLGHEWDEDVDNGFRPAGLMRLSSTTLDVNRYILDHGSTYGPGRGTHSLTLYRAASGALVFGAGTVQWGWGLDSAHDLFFTGDPRPPDPRMQQATVNLLADMGVQPASLQPELVRASQSTDATAPTTSIAAPADGATVQGGGTVTISGTAADAGGRVAGVEVSTDGGATWHPATGTSSWSYTWTAGGTGPATIRSRAVDDSGNLEAPQAGVTVTVVCPCTLFPATATPTTAATSDTKSIEVGLKFRSDVAGWITGLRFYKGAPNGGTHVGSLWRADGTLLARATFTGETGSGWQQVQFDDPVAISAATTYVASYFAPMGRYSLDLLAFSSGDVVNPPLRAPMSTTGDGNGLYTYTTGPAFPRSTHAGSNYWVDVVFDDSAPVDTVAPRIVATSPAAGAEDGDAFGAVEATVSEALAPATVTAATATLSTAAGAAVAAQVSWDAAARKIVIAPSAPLAYDAGYVVRIRGGAGGVEDRSGNALAADHTWAFTTAE
ncbi:MAG TPA: N,N-dimethylformamidase beta subunit family domain-containing protein, partial [Actinomycetota bacterium]